MAGALRAKTVHAYGSEQAKPAADGFLELAAYTVPDGRVLVADLHQLLGQNPAAFGLRPPLEVVAGVVWELYEAEADGKNRKQIPLTPTTNGIAWTRNDGAPIVCGYLLEGGRRLSWGINFDVSEVPAEFTRFAGAILGIEVDAKTDARELAALQVAR